MSVVHETLLEDQSSAVVVALIITIGTLTLQSHSHRRDEHELNEN
jgi:hypothetical protein